MHELGAFLITVILSMAGVGSPAPTNDLQNHADVAAAQQCAALAQSEDACLQTAQCDVFDTSPSTATCGLACDMRTTPNSCESDANCVWQNGYCDYPASDPVGC